VFYVTAFGFVGCILFRYWYTVDALLRAILCLTNHNQPCNRPLTHDPCSPQITISQLGPLAFTTSDLTTHFHHKPPSHDPLSKHAAISQVHNVTADFCHKPSTSHRSVSPQGTLSQFIFYIVSASSRTQAPFSQLQLSFFWGSIAWNAFIRDSGRTKLYVCFRTFWSSVLGQFLSCEQAHTHCGRNVFNAVYSCS
jgi:hypothetical protein